MSTAHPTDPGTRILASGAVALLLEGGRAEVWRCDWLVQVPNNNPEPDSIADCYDIVDCGAKMRVLPTYADSYVCDRGHERIPYETRCREGLDLATELGEHSYGERFWA